MRVTTWMLGLAAAVGLAAVLSSAHVAAEETSDAPAKKQAHPLYDDGGTLDWRTRLLDAQKIAGDRRRLIFIEWGRES
jgi:hypothetical protein